MRTLRCSWLQLNEVGRHRHSLFSRNPRATEHFIIIYFAHLFVFIISVSHKWVSPLVPRVHKRTYFLFAERGVGASVSQWCDGGVEWTV